MILSNDVIISRIVPPPIGAGFVRPSISIKRKVTVPEDLCFMTILLPDYKSFFLFVFWKEIERQLLV